MCSCHMQLWAIYNCKLLLLYMHPSKYSGMQEDQHMNHTHHQHEGSLRWATAKHALRCLIGCNILLPLYHLSKTAVKS
jgi:hypothetical protein